MILSVLPTDILINKASQYWRILAAGSLVISFVFLLTIVFIQAINIRNRRLVEKEQNKLIEKLKSALAKVKTLSGLLPICSSCKKIRDDKGYWQKVEVYIRDHSEAELSHGLCPECAKKLYPEVYKDNK
jgi:preprotein translocase subunit YajC